ncbi:hypothetical protein ACIPUP_05260 [Pectobacterium actinidiae]|uniref:Uncharacterized protein n=1 Tax=Pectobacterium actinidiae TaxID=1507808 RepID=A0ABW8G7B1_9GAMM
MAIMVEHEGHVVYREAQHRNIYDIPEYQITPLYAAPVPPAASQHVPDEIPETPDADAEVDAYNKGKTDGWNACRIAVLQLSGKDGAA